ncbi:hypothetical protein ACFWBI_08865 [Streptomyces sp. NPDC059982]|uniref:hypothetical protein n=1 Tax=unclassified Streptomyces TaxID=2593676 RepID=UPI0036AF6FCA
MKIRPDIAELIRDGLTNGQIAARLHVSRSTVAAARDGLGLPRCTATKHRNESPEDVLRARTHQTPDGHWLWTGPLDQGRVPRFRLNGRWYAPYRVAFTARTGRPPVGLVMASCTIPGCVAPACVDDRPDRERNRGAFAALFGGAS